MYIATRADLSPGNQLAQTSHASFEFAVAWPTITQDWCHRSNYLVCVAAPDEFSLAELATRATREGLAITIVREPDLGNEITAIVLEPGRASARLVAQLPLALRPDKTLRHRVRKAVTNHIGNTFGSGDEIADDVYWEVTNA